MNKPITVVGSVNMDLVMRIPQLPLPGETIESRAVDYCPGGKGANQAVAASRFGGDVSFLGCLGDDAFGAELEGVLAREKLQLAGLRTAKNTPTGIATILVDNNGENCIVVSPGANGCLTTEDFDRGAQLCAGGILVCQLETPLPVVTHAINRASRQGTTVVLNPSPVVSLDRELLDRELLQRVDYLVVNSGEAAFLSGVDVIDDASARQALEVLQDLGVASVLLTRGRSGVLVCHQGQLYSVAPPSVAAVDTTGAGDTFTGVFAAALSGGMEVKSAVSTACLAAALSVQVQGTMPSIPHRGSIEEFRTQHPEITEVGNG